MHEENQSGCARRPSSGPSGFSLCPRPRRGDYSPDRLPRGADRASAPRLNIMYRDCVNRPRGPVTQSTLCISSCVLPRPRGIFPIFRGGGSRVRQSGADHPSAPPGAQDLDEVPLEGTARIRQRFYLNVSELLCGQDCRLMPFGRVASAVAPHLPLRSRWRAKSRRSAVKLMPGRYPARPSRLSPAEPPGRPGETGRPPCVRPAPWQRETRAHPTNPTLRRESPAAAAIPQDLPPSPHC